MVFVKDGRGFCVLCMWAGEEHIGVTDSTAVTPELLISLISPKSVSYTHLRAHETRHDLVCRLLLEKKN